MIDRNKQYTLDELLNIYSFYNLDFKYYGNRENGTLELYLKTDVDKISVFKTINKQMPLDYLKLDENEAKQVIFQFDREENEMDLDIVAVVIMTSDINIPSGKYKLETLDRLTREQDLENRMEADDGISYIIIDQNSTCSLYDDVYMFDKDKGGLIKNLEDKLKNETNSLLRENLKMILDYYYTSQKEKVL